MVRRFSVLILMLLVSGTAIGRDLVRRHARPVTGEYIVVLPETSDVPATATALTRDLGGRAITSWTTVVHAFLVRMNDSQAQQFARSPLVAWVEENAEVDLATAQSIPSWTPGQASLWALDRIDQRTVGAGRFDSTFNYCSTGAGVRVYVVDTGIMEFHSEFGGSCINNDCRTPANRSTGRVDKAPSLQQLYATNGLSSLGADCWDQSVYSSASAHGTAVGSLVAGQTFGVAKGVTLVDARVFPCGGVADTAHVLTALNWIPSDPNRGTAARVVNCSFEFSSMTQDGNAMIAAVNSLTDTYGMTVVAAAGNSATNTFWVSPAFASRVITAGGLSQGGDTPWYVNANYGSNYANIEFYAPAQYVEAAHTAIKGLILTLPRDQVRSESDGCQALYVDTCTSGTSFAAPLISGGVARYLQSHPTAARDTVVAYLNSQSSTHTAITVTASQGGSAPLYNINDCP